MRADDRERGSATVWVAVAGFLVLALAVLGMYLGAAAVTRHRAETAADLAALAAAGSAPLGADGACQRAQVIAEQNGARLYSCSLEGWDALVEVVAHPPEPLANLGEVTAHARAGPATP